MRCDESTLVLEVDRLNNLTSTTTGGDCMEMRTGEGDDFQWKRVARRMCQSVRRMAVCYTMIHVGKWGVFRL